MNNNPDKKILAVVGAGHEDDILDLVKKKKDSAVSYEFTVK